MKKTSIILGLLFITIATYSQTIIEKTIKVKDQENVSMDFDFADEIKIKGWDKNEIYVKVSVNINDNEDNDSFKFEVDEFSSSINLISEIEDMKRISKKQGNYP